MTQAYGQIHAGKAENGLELRTVEMRDIPAVAFAFVLQAGSEHDGAGLEGTANLTAASIDAGTALSDISTLAERIEFLGTSLQFSAMQDVALIVGYVLKRHLREIMSIVGEILTSASFPAHEIERLRTVQLTSLLQMRDRPAARAAHALDRILFGQGHPYGRPIMGMQESVARITREDVVEFFARHVRPEGTIALATGDVSAEEWRNLCGEFLDGWHGSPENRKPLADPEGRTSRELFVIDRPGTPQAEVRIGCTTLQRNHPDYLGAVVLNHCLGGQFTSRLNSSLREKRGLTYGAWSTLSTLRSSGMWILGGAYDTARTDEAVAVTFEELQRIIDEGITDEELRYAKQSLAGSFLRAFETPAQICSRLQGVYAYDLPVDYYATYIGRLNALTLDDVTRIGRTWLHPEQCAVVAVGDASVLRGKFEQLHLGETRIYDDA
jgi:zinc protease